MSHFRARKPAGQAAMRQLLGLPNPGAGVGKLILKLAASTFNAGSTTSVLPVDTGTPEHFLRIRPVAETNWRIGLAMDATGFGLIFGRSDNNHWTTWLGRISEPQANWTSVSSGNYIPYTTTPVYPTTVFEGRKNLNGSFSFVQDGTVARTLPPGIPLYGNYVAFAQASGSAPQDVTYGGNAVPILPTTTRLTGLYEAEIDFDYTNAGGVQCDTPKIQLFLADGVTPIGSKQTAVLVGNPLSGKATVRSVATYGPDQFGTKPVIKLYEVVNGVETGSTATTSVTMAAAPFRIGTNYGVVAGLDSFSSYQDYWKAGGTSSGTCDSFGTPSAVGYTRNFRSPPDGAAMELEWTQTTGTDAVWVAALSSCSVTPLAALAGRRRARVISVGASNAATATTTVGQLSVQLSSFPAGDPPTNIKCYVAGADKTQLTTPTRKAFTSNFACVRQMDNTNANGGAVFPGDYQPLFSDRTLSNHDNNHSAVGLLSIEDACRIANDANADLWWSLPMYWSDDYYSNFLPLVDSLLSPGKKAYIEYGNEITNFLLAGGRNTSVLKARYTARTGIPYAGDGSGGVQQICNEFSFECKRVFNLMQPTIANFSSRVVRVFSCFSATTTLGQADAVGFTEYDAITPPAPYVPIGLNLGANVKISDQSPANLKVLWLAQMNQTVDGMLSFRDVVRARGKRFIGYEFGAQWFDNHVDVANIVAFKRSPEYFDCYYAYLNRLRTEFGDLWCHYFDVGGYGSIYTWSLKETDLAPTQRGLDAVLAIQALG